jgi:GDPmannose 4,6-dehydratase
MKKKKAFITGINGQDGSYLAEHLLENDYKVYGILRRSSTAENQDTRISHLFDNPDLSTEYGDVLDTSSLDRMLKSIKPDEIYNLAAQSHVRISFDVPQFTVNTNAMGVLNLLESYKTNCPEARFYQASSSEMFGRSVDQDDYQRETTHMEPTSPYGCAKVFGYNIVRHYRFAHNLFAVNGILFNHESPRRGSNFVTNKVVKSAVRIKLGLQDNLVMGNLDSYRDWGHSKDYVRAMNMIVNHEEPDDFVVSTGVTHSVGDMCNYVFDKLGMVSSEFITQDPRFMRAEELKYLRGDCTKIKNVLGWTPEYTFETMMDEMIQHWLEVYNK